MMLVPGRVGGIGAKLGPWPYGRRVLPDLIEAQGRAQPLTPLGRCPTLAIGRKPMPPTRPGTSIIEPLFFHRAARDLVGRLTRQGACFAAIPHATAPARDTWAARGERHEHPACVQRPIRRRQAQADVFGGREGYRKT